MILNINENVFVRLTDHGRDILRKNGVEVPPEDAKGYSRWQLWCLMQEFGPYIGMGRTNPFDLNLYIREDPCE